MNFQIEVNNKKLEAKQGETILEVLTRNGMQVPTLCHMKDMIPTGSCRMCVVELENNGRLVPSCSFPASPEMKIKTHSPGSWMPGRPSWNCCSPTTRMTASIASAMKTANCRAFPGNCM